MQCLELDVNNYYVKDLMLMPRDILLIENKGFNKEQLIIES
jgi:hypothetical protein